MAPSSMPARPLEYSEFFPCIIMQAAGYCRAREMTCAQALDVFGQHEREASPSMNTETPAQDMFGFIPIFPLYQPDEVCRALVSFIEQPVAPTRRGIFRRVIGQVGEDGPLAS